MSKMINPLTCLDYPDPDVIRVEDTYYMISTTMHFFPGGEILRSYDLVNWEHLTYVYDVLDSTPGQRLEEGEQIYGKGMWAAAIRFHKGIFYVCFVANDTGKTYLYTAEDICGPWKKRVIEGFYHDCSLLFDEDDRVYIAYGNKHIHLVELKPDLSAPLEGGLNRIVVSDEGHPGLGYEGTHFYKINGKYYLFFIHSLRDQWKRVEACFVADSLEGEFVGGDVLNDDIGYCNQGVAQGGIVDTPDGEWYGILFQDRGAVGRIPVLVPVHWEKDYPVFGVNGKVPETFPATSNKPEYEYHALITSDDFMGTGNVQEYGSFGLKSAWQFNHEPELSLTKLDTEKGIWKVTTGKLCEDVTQAKNTITQRMLYPGCIGEILVNGSALKDGDFAGLCALQGCYGFAALTKKDGKLYLTMRSREADNGSLQALGKDSLTENEWECISWDAEEVRLRVCVDFTNMKDEATFYYKKNVADAEWKQIGKAHKLYFKMDHFTGCRFGLFIYATKEVGGSAEFQKFEYRLP